LENKYKLYQFFGDFLYEDAATLEYKKCWWIINALEYSKHVYTPVFMLNLSQQQINVYCMQLEIIVNSL
jgi:hypothetical protein